MSEQRSRHLPRGTIIGDFEIGDVLGQGGFGITYKAHDRRLDRQVAIKEFFPSEFATRAADTTTVEIHSDKSSDYSFALEKFLEEARTLARFDHPNIVPVIGFLEANNTAYLIMKYVEGQTLSEYLRAHPGTLPEKQVKAWFTAILSGLIEVHKVGFLHRDIKPGNIYLHRNQTPLLIDFGAARLAIGEQSRTVTGLVTPGYAPTEQYATDSKKQGPWTDLYSVGATLYRCVAGKNPVDSPTRQSAIMEGEDDPLVPASIVGADRYSAGLLALADQLLALSIKSRPDNAETVLAALAGGDEVHSGDFPTQQTYPPTEQLVDDEAATVVSQALPEPAQARGKGMMLGVGVAALVLAALGGFFLYSSGEQVPEPPVVALPESSGEKPATAEALPEPTEPDNEPEVVAAPEPASPVATPAEPVPVASPPSYNVGDEFRDALAGGGEGPNMIVLPAGSFQKGNASNKGQDDELPRHRVTIPSMFALGKHEVTHDEFARFAKATGARLPSDDGWGRGARPVIFVSWEQANDYTRWLSEETGHTYRLPSESEWEFATRAGSDTHYFFGDRPDMICRYANVTNREGTQSRMACNDDFPGTAPSGSFWANNFGLLDVYGNVWEWTADCYHRTYVGAPTDGSAWVDNCERDKDGSVMRVLRGGSYFDIPERMRSSQRLAFAQEDAYGIAGFRVLREL